MKPQDESSSSKSLTNTPVDHPNAVVSKPTVQQPVLANRVYIVALLSEIFENPEIPGSTQSTINLWVGNFSGIFGYPCNPRGRFGLSDCGGITLATMNPLPDTLRTSNKSQLCLTLTSNPTFLQNALMKIDKRPSQPDLTSITQLLTLFYRSENDFSFLANQLLIVDKQIKSAEPTITDLDRWRILTNMICESPDWEIL